MKFGWVTKKQNIPKYIQACVGAFYKWNMKHGN